jgi:hypothetical protein
LEVKALLQDEIDYNLEIEEEKEITSEMPPWDPKISRSKKIN